MKTQYFEESFSDNYLFTKKFTPIKDIEKDCFELEDTIKKKFNNYLTDPFEGAPFTTKTFRHYNLLSVPRPSFHELYVFIKECVDNLLLESREPHYIQCWLNIYTQKTPNIDWHFHWEPPYKGCWHGFYCASIPEPSGTLYKIPSEKDELYIPSVEGKMVIGKSQGDLHKSTPHSHERPRITIAFDVVPYRILNNFPEPNHWIPI